MIRLTRVAHAVAAESLAVTLEGDCATVRHPNGREYTVSLPSRACPCASRIRPCCHIVAALLARDEHPMAVAP